MGKIKLALLSEEQFERTYAEKIGLCSDEAYEIMCNGEVAGIIMIDNCNPHFGGECTFIDWVEIYPQFRGKSLFPEVLSQIFHLYKTKQIHFESSEENVPMYLHLGAVETGISELTENHMMILNQNDFEKTVKKHRTNSHEWVVEM